MSVAYKRPLHIVRGEGAYLYDENNQPYLDGVNNVAHVGHCHPHVVQAAQWQTAVIVNKMRDKGIFISSDGTLHNVLKIKPPLVFTQENADLLVEALGEILEENG